MSTRLVILACALLASACSAVPRSGPLTADVYDEAAAPEALGFELIETDAEVVRRLGAVELGDDLTRLARGPAIYGRRLRTGDRVQVMLFEATGGGLFSGSVEGGGGARALPEQIVSANGTIRVPYGGNVRVRGLSPEAAARRIEAALQGQAIEPQAVVSLVSSPSASVTVLGDAVAGGGRVPLSGTGERVLDMVAAAGGLSKPIHESALRLTRKQSSALVEMDALLAEPAQNVAVHPADVISVEHRPRHFSVLGAVAQNARIGFDRPRLSLDEALGMANGLVDARADAAGVFVIRYEAPSVLVGMPQVPGARLAGYGAEPVPVVYRLDFSKPSGLLLAKRFPIRHRDTLYVANSELNSLEKIFRIVSLALQPVTTGAVIGNLVVN
ncbi:polysaccharide biosynthesis/export family protein [Paralimibaculum aggregatum]|uniref:Polysaccharide biosynthesis/export family protein n=1 Tax=Paralimibaculum aggregatum TaxID=3036245 RepID=A0ABQ6LBP6_9RHOB|nr:polysaccharide biosynthesis/export family protein [Limibaculum sp. NKW23]GMG80808.1 polysaccharide biosynthesis/export family protein [Limibaculum sp. NKW23]